MEEIVKLVFNAKNKDINSFEKLISYIEKDLHRIGKERFNNAEDINDAIQETVINAYHSINQLENPQYFKAWIIKIFINKCNQIYKKNKKNLILFKKVKNTIDINELDITNIINIENKIEVERVLNKLSYNERLSIILSYNNYTINEISEILKIKPNTVKSKIRRTKDKIKEIIEKDESTIWDT